MIGKEVYYLNVAEDKVLKGIVIGYTVNNDGRLLINVKSEDGRYIAVEESLSYSSEEEAKSDIIRVKELDDKIKNIQKKANEEIDSLKIEILGEPKYKHIYEEEDIIEE